MRNILLGAIAGLAVGTVGALAYSHFLGEGSQLASLQAQLDAANASLAKALQDKQQLAKQSSGSTDEMDQLAAANADLKRQLDEAKKATGTAAPALNPVTLGGMVMGMFRGGGFQSQQRMFLLQSRLHLTPDQATAIKAAMDADAKARRDVMQQMYRDGGKVDPQAAANANTLDKTLASVLTPDQQTAYQQVQADEKTSRADTAATVQMNQVAPLLQLTDAQKDQVFNALYQVQMSAPDPASLMTNPNAATLVTSQAQATEDALSKILTPDQMALYQQQAQSMPSFDRRNRGGGGGGTPPATTATAPAAAP